MLNVGKIDKNWKSGRTFNLVYYAGEGVSNIEKGVYQLFFHENSSNPIAFQGLKI